MTSRVHIGWLWGIVALAATAVSLPASVQAGPDGEQPERSTTGQTQTGQARTDATQTRSTGRGSIQLQPAARRSPYFAQLDVGANLGLGLMPSWGSLPVGSHVRVSAGMSLSRSFAVFASIGVLSEIGTEFDRFRATSTVGERFRLLPVRMNARLNLWPRPDWLEVNAIGGVSLAFGSRDLMRGDTIIASDNLFSIGAGGGLELAIVKFKRTGLSLKTQYFFQPALLDDAGFATGGFTDVGGLEVTLGLVGYLGGPR